MSMSSAAIGAAEQARFDDDKPVLIGRNWARSASSAKWTATKDAGAADITSSTAIASRGYDDYDYLLTQPNASATNAFYIIDLGSELAEIDSIVLLNHSGQSLGVTDIEVYLDDTSTFPQAAVYSSGAPADDKRIVALSLDHTGGGGTRRYSNVRYIAIEFTGASATHQLGELIIGRRRQMGHQPLSENWDPRNLRSRVREFESQSGVVTRFVDYTGRRYINAVFGPDAAADITDLETFFETETDGATLPYVFIDEPTTTPSDAYWMVPELPEMNGPIGFGPFQRLFALTGKEQGPNFISTGI